MLSLTLKPGMLSGTTGDSIWSQQLKTGESRECTQQVAFLKEALSVGGKRRELVDHVTSRSLNPLAQH